MNLDELVIFVYVTIADELKIVRQPLHVGRLRQGGPAAKLSDAEALTIECVGELLGLDADKRVFAYFARRFRHYFPALAYTHRAAFARQVANLWHVKGLLWCRLAEDLAPAADQLRQTTPVLADACACCGVRLTVTADDLAGAEVEALRTRPDLGVSGDAARLIAATTYPRRLRATRRRSPAVPGSSPAGGPAPSEAFQYRA